MIRQPSIVDSPAWVQGRPLLSVLIPFLRDDPVQLIGMLAREQVRTRPFVEIILMDDGTGDPDLTARVAQAVRTLEMPARLITLNANEGRSLGRNRLASHARGESLLFLDSDMRPDTDRFLATWIDLIAKSGPAVAFGGFSLVQASDDRRFAVHRAMATRSDCVPSRIRELQPEKYVFTSNLLVRRDVFDSQGFDPSFSGWGWEDVEWAMRVSRRYPVIHIDNPATHMGLDTVESLAAKYEQSVPNFARVVATHPDIVMAYPSYKAARLLKRLPGLAILRPLIRRAASAPVLPVPARGFALRLYRAALYARVV